MAGYDFAVVGAGIAGASAAYELQARGPTVLIEREPMAGQHTTGRSAAFLVESYGNPVVQRLTRGGRAFLESPPPGFADHPLVGPRPVLYVARPEQRQRLAEDAKQAAESGVRLRSVQPEEAQRLCPVLRPGYAAAALLEPDALHIDVAGLLEAYLRGFRARGGDLTTNFEATGVWRRDGVWEIRSGERRVEADVLVNAAGAWAERIGGMAGARSIGLQPLRRTAITFDPPHGADVRGWPCLIDAEERFYVKPEGTRLLASPCDETPSLPCDAEPDDLDVALAAERVKQATTLELRHIRRRWAGLRSFVADRAPVIGMDPDCEGFFWLAGQGGFGIMTSSSAARASTSLICDGTLPRDLLALGVSEKQLSPARLR